MSERVVLAIDTSTVVAVGLAVDDAVVARAVVTDRMAHVEQLMPLVRQVFDTAGLAPARTTAIVSGLGPGPFTGLRVGIVTARTLAYAWSARVHGVCSLDVLAAQHVSALPPPASGGDFCVAIDARRQEVYWARYDGTGRRIDGPSVGRPELLPLLPSGPGQPPVPVVGPGAIAYADRLGLDRATLELHPDPLELDPGQLALYGLSIPSMGTEPLYLRRPDAAEPGRRKRVTSFRARQR